MATWTPARKGGPGARVERRRMFNHLWPIQGTIGWWLISKRCTMERVVVSCGERALYHLLVCRVRQLGLAYHIHMNGLGDRWFSLAFPGFSSFLRESPCRLVVVPVVHPLQDGFAVVWQSVCHVVTLISCGEEYDPFPPGLLLYALRDPFDFFGFGRSKLPVLVDEHDAL